MQAVAAATAAAEGLRPQGAAVNGVRVKLLLLLLWLWQLLLLLRELAAAKSAVAFQCIGVALFVGESILNRASLNFTMAF